MTILFESGARADTNEKSLKHTIITVGTSAVEVKVDPVRDPSRQYVFIYNDSNSVIYLGNSSVTTSGTTKGYPLQPQAGVTFAIGDIGLFAIAATAGNSVLVMELA